MGKDRESDSAITRSSSIILFHSAQSCQAANKGQSMHSKNKLYAKLFTAAEIKSYIF